MEGGDDGWRGRKKKRRRKGRNLEEKIGRHERPDRAGEKSN